MVSKSSSSTMSDDNCLMTMLTWLMHINNINVSASESMSFHNCNMWLMMWLLNDNYMWLWLDEVRLLNNNYMRLRLDVLRLDKDATSNYNFLLNVNVQNVS